MIIASFSSLGSVAHSSNRTGKKKKCAYKRQPNRKSLLFEQQQQQQCFGAFGWHCTQSKRRRINLIDFFFYFFFCVFHLWVSLSLWFGWRIFCLISFAVCATRISLDLSLAHFPFSRRCTRAQHSNQFVCKNYDTFDATYNTLAIIIEHYTRIFTHYYVLLLLEMAHWNCYFENYYFEPKRVHSATLSIDEVREEKRQIEE